MAEELHLRIMEKLGRMEATLKIVADQSTITNGRVRALEKFKWIFIGGLIVTNVILVPVFVHWINEVAFKISLLGM